MNDSTDTARAKPRKKLLVLAGSAAAAMALVAIVGYNIGAASTSGRIDSLQEEVEAATERGDAARSAAAERLAEIDALTLERDELAADLAATDKALADRMAERDTQPIGALAEELAALVGGNVLTASDKGSGRVEIETTIVDPRGDDGSPAAREAISICERADALPGVETVAIYENDGTTFVVRNDAFGPGCVEV